MRALCLASAPAGCTQRSAAVRAGLQPQLTQCRRHRRLCAPPASSAPKRTDFDDPNRYPEAPHLHQPVPEPSLESQRDARERGTPEHVFAREQELDVRAVSHAERAAAHQHTFPELIHGQPGEAAPQQGMSDEQRQIMESHLHPGLEPRGGQPAVPHVGAEDARAWGAPDTGASQPSPSSGRPLNEPDAGHPTSAAGREGGGATDGGKAQQAPPTAGGMKPRQNRSPPVDDVADEEQ